EGWGIEMVPIMTNDFVIAGSLDDPAGLGGLSKSAGAAGVFRRIAAAGTPFISRGDNSGTHIRELEMWRRAGVTPAGDWYIKSSDVAGNPGALRLASERQGYTFVDRASFLLAGEKNMGIFSPAARVGDPDWNLENVFVIILVNPERVPWVKLADARLFSQWLRGKEGQKLISSFGRESIGKPLFTGVL
ncbi:MAG: substrate-binding domain-containing protein, partial [Dethiobacteria bacterium]